jgi:hypothetical protein
MSREAQPFEQDFLLITETERRVRQAMQYSQLDQAALTVLQDTLWEWDATNLHDEQTEEQRFDEGCPTLWECTLERL